MRLLDTLTLELVEFTEEIPLYAILSHRWGPKELTLQDLTENKVNNVDSTANNQFNNKAGFDKVQKLCSVAASHGLQYAWVDTCCIDKTSSAELSEAMNSMYRWYQDSAVCFAFLGDVQRHGDLWAGGVDLPFAKRYPGFSASVWFTRGWTLQELIAPSMPVPYPLWNYWDSRRNSRRRVPQTASIAQRMSWASRRKTARVEDTAYCLMGLFDVNMPMLYGEGEKAFIRLQEQIIKTSDDHTIFAWGFSAALSNHPNGGLLASSPAAFSSCRDIVPWDSPNARNTLSRVISTDNKGIHLKLNFVPGKDWSDLHTAILPCGRVGSCGKWIGIPLKAMSPSLQCFKREPSLRLQEMSLDMFPEFAYPQREICVQHGAQGNKRQTPIVKAAEHGNEALVRFLLEKGVDPESRDEHNRTPLLAAAKAGRNTVVEVLITFDANMEAVDTEGYTPLLLATMGGHLATVQVLAGNGARVDATSGNGQTSLIWAAQEGFDAVAKLLLEEGANLDAVDDTESTALIWAVLREHEAVARVLIEGGANLEVVDGGGHTPLLCAAESGQTEMVRLLIEHGANIRAVDEYGNTPFKLASRKGHEEVARLLTKKGWHWKF